MKTAEVILTPALLPLYQLQGKTVVVIDILRATSSMCVAFTTGVQKILPVSTPEEALIFKDFDFVIAAERNAEKVEGFDMGNSPFEFHNPLLAGKNIAFTTTNGTKAIKLSKEALASKIVIGSFLNLTVLCNWLNQQHEDIILLCSGWKDKFNMEDTLFAGAVIHKLGSSLQIKDDAAKMALDYYQLHQHNLEEIVRKSSHAQRFKLLNVQTDDVSFCLQMDICAVIPIMQGEYLVKLA